MIDFVDLGSLSLRWVGFAQDQISAKFAVLDFRVWVTWCLLVLVFGLLSGCFELGTWCFRGLIRFGGFGDLFLVVFLVCGVGFVAVAGLWFCLE